MLAVKLDVRAINQAIDENVFGEGGVVCCDLADGTRCRIIDAKSVRGQLVVKRFDNDKWVYPAAVCKEW